MIHADAHGEVVVTLNDGEPEAIPLQRVRRGQYVVLPLLGRHLAVLNRNQLNISGIGDRVPDDVRVVGEFEPAAVRVVPGADVN
ncbi:hypothetical protein BHQ20_28920 [Mycobacterium intermedium]|nr:hypothetical protein BHQ20_28920 [Mycobacterium intermedium]